MVLCTCEKCRYTFLYPIIPIACPDCGAESVRKATAPEIQEFIRLQKILQEEIRAGIWGDHSDTQAVCLPYINVPEYQDVVGM